MEMSLTKSYTRSITIKFQTWKYSTTLSRTVVVASAKQLSEEAEKLWKQAKVLTELDCDRDEAAREKWLKECIANNYISQETL